LSQKTSNAKQKKQKIKKWFENQNTALGHNTFLLKIKMQGDPDQNLNFK
jgi:hypothetical protein